MVVDTIRSAGGVSSFSTLLGETYDRAKAIGVFVALLELCKRRMISVEQEAPRAEISIRLSGVEVDAKAAKEIEEEWAVEAA
jgi:chromatin segregation and condensation protein Rec8/ScpA/Scc1 (kleisin family)